MQQCVLATHNQGKLRECRAALSETKLTLCSAAELALPPVEETGLTFIENALIKARHAARLSGLPALSDDSGLSVAALGGAPGVRSARYSAEGTDLANRQKLLAAMAEIPVNARLAVFDCVMVYLTHPEDPSPVIAQGRWQGRIAFEAVGTQGFGYDPVFFIPELNCTAAALSITEKQAISHRGMALRQLIAYFKGGVDD